MSGCASLCCTIKLNLELVIYLQGDKIRRRDEWSKWIPASADSTLTSKPQSPLGQLVGKSMSAMESTASDDKVEPSSDVKNLMEHVPSNNMKQESNSVLVDGASLVFTGGHGNSNVNLTSESSRKSSYLGTSYHSTCSDHSQGSDPVRFDEHVTEGTEKSSDVAVKNLDDLSNDFANTFMLDEELEFEHKTMKKDVHSSVRRYFNLLDSLYYIILSIMFYNFSILLGYSYGF